MSDGFTELRQDLNYLNIDYDIVQVRTLKGTHL